ncbi:MAG: hypothetical protein HY220_00765 [Candidatus Sungbacteria bacterium]|uniref:Uncharacterized protein n=1 Tax=Candidatus Sungiibacteriota bacterium TaxID=2750080 RepID=A0A9D6LMW3_9BACT|nr:hypothetical protein [Candidatus Sungbacteria bacterium]
MSNLYTQSLESKLYFVVFFLSSSFLAVQIYRSGLYTIVLDAETHQSQSLTALKYLEYESKSQSEQTAPIDQNAGDVFTPGEQIAPE